MEQEETDAAAAELRVTVEMSDNFEPGPRTAAALQELVAALDVEHGDDDVAGFGQSRPELRSFTYMVTPSTNLFEAWPSEWKVSEMDGKSNN